jgi:hypothetical protein
MLVTAPPMLLGRLVLLSEWEEPELRLRLQVVADCERCESTHWHRWPFNGPDGQTIHRDCPCGRREIALDPKRHRENQAILEAHRLELARARQPVTIARR